MAVPTPRRPRRPRSPRSTALSLLAFGFAIRGAGMLLANGDGYEPSSRHAVLLALLPWSAWGWIHLTAAAAVLALTILRLGTPALAVGLLAGVAATWSIGLTVGAFASRSLTAAPTAVVWLTLTALVVVVAGWPDPSTAREGDRSDDDPPP